MSRFLWRVLSVPIFVKILGVGLVVTVLFGSVAFYESRAGIYRAHYRIHGRKALSVATALAEQVQPYVLSGEIAAVDAELDRTMKMYPDTKYVVIQDTAGKILSHGLTFPKEAPPDLLAQGGDLCASCHATLTFHDIATDLLEVPSNLDFSGGRIREYMKNDRLMLEANVNIGREPIGTVRLGVGDNLIAHEISSISSSMLVALSACAALGVSLALGLAYLIVRPIHNLVHATNRIREGDFRVRARVFSGDEIGALSIALNQMAEGLERYRDEVQENDAARVSLIGKIVQAQEEERKNISRELHDHFGQNLSNALLGVEALCKELPPHSERGENLRFSIRGLIDDVRRMAWDARPSILDDYGVDHALRRYVEEMSKRVTFPIDYQCAIPKGWERLPSEIEITLYRIAQEAMTNVIRHARPARASIVLMRHDEEVTLIVEDDGRGFDVKTAKRHKDTMLGLIGMEERAALVGGELAVDSQVGIGTTVRVRIPVNGRVHADTLADSR